MQQRRVAGAGDDPAWGWGGQGEGGGGRRGAQGGAQVVRAGREGKEGACWDTEDGYQMKKISTSSKDS